MYYEEEKNRARMLRSAKGPILNSVVKESSTAKVTFEQTPAGSEGESHGAISH